MIDKLSGLSQRRKLRTHIKVLRNLHATKKQTLDKQIKIFIANTFLIVYVYIYNVLIAVIYSADSNIQHFKNKSAG